MSLREPTRIERDVPQLLYDISDARDRLVKAGMPTDGRAAFFDREHKNFIVRSAIWLLGSSVVTRELQTSNTPERSVWHVQLIDVDIETGEVHRLGQSNLGVGIRHGNATQEFHTLDVPLLRHTNEFISELAVQLRTSPDTVSFE